MIYVGVSESVLKSLSVWLFGWKNWQKPGFQCTNWWEAKRFFFWQYFIQPWRIITRYRS